MKALLINLEDPQWGGQTTRLLTKGIEKTLLRKAMVLSVAQKAVGGEVSDNALAQMINKRDHKGRPMFSEE